MGALRAAPIALAVVLLALVLPAASMGATVGELDVRVLTPPGYAGDTGRWPVVYVVPGSGEDASEGVASLDLASYAARNEAIVVTVAEPGGNGQNFLTDYVDGTHRFETSFFADVLPWVERNYRTGRRAIAGYSAGGYSAAALASRHPGTFAAVGSISGVVDLEDLGPTAGYVILAPVIAFDGPQRAFAIWGEPIRDRANFHAHNPTALAAALAGTPAVFISSRSGRAASVDEASEAGIAVVPATYAETAVARWTGNYHRALLAAGVRHVLRVAEGLHGKQHFRADFAEFWPQAVRALRGSQGRDAVGDGKPAVRVSVRPRRVRAGRRVRLRLRVESRSASCRRGVLVRVGGGRPVRTNRRGRATVTVRLRRPGLRRVVTRKLGCRKGTARLRVLRPPR